MSLSSVALLQFISLASLRISYDQLTELRKALALVKRWVSAVYWHWTERTAILPPLL